MINLISYTKRAEIKAGRANVIIRNYILLTVAAAVLLAGIVGTAFLTLNTLREGAQARVAQNASEIAEFNEVTAKANSLRSNLATAKQIIDNEISYSKAYLRIASVLPSGVVISDLALDSSAAGQPMKLTAKARTEAIALSLKSSLQSRPDIFTNVYFDSVTTGSGAGGTDGQSADSSGYPYSVSITATLSEGIFK